MIILTVLGLDVSAALTILRLDRLAYHPIFSLDWYEESLSSRLGSVLFSSFDRSISVATMIIPEH